MDDVTALQAMTPEIMSSSLHLCPPRDAVLWKEDVREDRAVPGDKNWTGESARAGTFIQFYLGSSASDDVTIDIAEATSGEQVRTIEAPGHQGLNRVQWNLEADPEDPEEDDEGEPVEPGVYRVTVTAVPRSPRSCTS